MADFENNYKELIAAHPDWELADLGDVIEGRWYHDYRQKHGSLDGVTVSLCEHGATFKYIFDMGRERLVGVYGMPIYNATKRDTNRQDGAPNWSKQSNEKYVRGHMIAHVLGGGMDINFVRQLRSTNESAFKKIENKVCKLAKENERCLYFVHCLYTEDSKEAPPKPPSQTPEKLEQGVIHFPRQSTNYKFPGQLTKYKMHDNV